MSSCSRLNESPAPTAAVARVALAAAMLAALYLSWSTRESVVLEKGAADFEPGSSRWMGGPAGYEFNPDVGKQGCKRHHAVGNTWGRFVYRFRVPALARVGQPRLSATLSSEHAWWSAPADWDSDVRVTVNGTLVATTRVIPDDGAGRTYTWPVPAGLVEPGKSVLVGFEVAQDAARRHGLCVYSQSMVPGVPDATVRLELDPRPSR